MRLEIKQKCKNKVTDLEHFIVLYISQQCMVAIYDIFLFTVAASVPFTHIIKYRSGGRIINRSAD